MDAPALAEALAAAQAAVARERDANRELASRVTALRAEAEAARREAAERRDASGFEQARHYRWSGPGDGTRSRDEMRALEVLELEPDADFEAVRAAWRRLAKANHPDVRPGDAEAATRFQAIQAAYDVLRVAEEAKSWRPA